MRQNSKDISQINGLAQNLKFQSHDNFEEPFKETQIVKFQITKQNKGILHNNTMYFNTILYFMFLY